MDLFVYSLENVGDIEHLRLHSGEMLSGWKSATWVERYQELSFFEIETTLDSGLLEKLPEGSYVGNIDSPELMVVENHLIKSRKNQPSIVTISGRSIESIFTKRAIGMRSTRSQVTRNYNFSSGSYTAGHFDNIFPAVLNGRPQFLARDLLQMYFRETNSFQGSYGFTGGTGVTSRNARDHIQRLRVGIGSMDMFLFVREHQVLSHSDVYSQAMSIIKIFDGGLRTIRAGVGRPEFPSVPTTVGAGGENTILLIHRGRNRTQHVSFSHLRGDVESADYLFSSKNYVNGVVVFEKSGVNQVEDPVMRADATLRENSYSKEETVIGTTSWGAPSVTQNFIYNGMRRKSAAITSPDIDWNRERGENGQYITQPSVIQRQLGSYGRTFLEDSANKRIEVSNISLAENINGFIYRVDYDIGDLVTFEGEYGPPQVMRVSEFAQIEDELGYREIPTLVKPGE